MPLPIPYLDDRRFDDLVAEARARLSSHVPEWTDLAPGDPAVAFIELFAWYTETILYRANLIPERQRRAFLNLLRLPVAPALAARGMVAIDSALKSAEPPPLLPAGTALAARGVAVTTRDELAPTALNLSVLSKRPVSAADLQAAGITAEQLEAHYRMPVLPFRPVVSSFPGFASLADSLDRALWLCLWVPRAVAGASEARSAVAGRIINLGFVPAADAEAEEAARELPARRWLLEAVAADSSQPDPVDGAQPVRRRPLEILADSTRGGRVLGIVRVRLPDVDALVPPSVQDPQFAGVGDTPPEAPDTVPADQVVCWLRLSCPEDVAVQLAWMGVNAVSVKAQGSVRERVVAVGDGRPDQVIDLGQRNIDPDGLLVEVERGEGSNATWQPWSRVEHLGAVQRDDLAYVADARAGFLRFGDGLRGRRLPAGKRVRVSFLFGGGVEGNLPAAAITGLAASDARYRVRHELPLGGGVAEEEVSAAEQRIGAFLTHRDRAVTLGDYRSLALEHPTAPVARAEVVPGLVPSPSPALVRRDVPGAVSVFVLPPLEFGIGRSPRASAGLLRDVYSYLAARRCLGTELYVLSPAWRPLAVSLRVELRNAALELETLREVESAIARYLWALAGGGSAGQGWPMGADVDPGELTVVAARVANVRKVSAVGLWLRSGANGASGPWARLPVGAAVPIDDFTLPELAAVMVAAGAGEPSLPPGLEAMPTSSLAVPAPVIPERC